MRYLIFTAPVVAVLVAALSLTPGNHGALSTGVQGDVDCNARVDSVDALHVLRDVAGLSSAQCIATAGNVNCDAGITSLDALDILRFVAGLPPLPAPPACPAIGESAVATPTPSQPPEETPTPSPSQSPVETPTPAETPPPSGTPTATPTATPTPTPTSTPTPTATPTRTATPTVTPTSTPPPTPTPTPTRTPTPTPTPTPIPPPADGFTLAQIAPEANWSAMTGLHPLPESSDEALVLTQDGHIWRISLSSAFTPAPFADLTGILATNRTLEDGLLGFAYSPDYATDRNVYVYYNAPAHPGFSYREVLSRFHVSGDALETGSQQILIDLDDSRPWHNGGQLAFGPDGMLYLGIGDGGWAGDPDGHGQSLATLFGKVLRLDVTGQTTYAIPADNPFVNTPGSLGEIYAYGFRNPWRFSFDGPTGELWLGDVGQWNWEEIDNVVAGGNYGWNVMEGNNCFNVAPGSCTPPAGYVPPRDVYCHDDYMPSCPLPDTCAVIGGSVYRGSAMPDLYGWYVFGDYCSGEVWALYPGSSNGPAVRLLDSAYLITSLAMLPDGEIAVITQNNAIFELGEP